VAELVPETYERITDHVVSLDADGRVTYLDSHAERDSAWLAVALSRGDTGTTVFLTDVTVKKRREEEIDELRAALATSESTIRSLEANISRPTTAFRAPD
jgi:hypothetical protein